MCFLVPAGALAGGMVYYRYLCQPSLSRVLVLVTGLSILGDGLRVLLASGLSESALHIPNKVVIERCEQLLVPGREADTASM